MQRVVITGASSGIGAACVTLFKEQGVEVIGVDLTDRSEADLHVRLDLANPTCGNELLEFCKGLEIDGLVNNAGIGLNMKAVDTSVGDFDHVVAVNLRAPYLLACALHPVISGCRGFVVNVGSVHANATSDLVSAYAASKGGLVSLTRALAVEWGPSVRVNAVLPGAIETTMLRDGLHRQGHSLEELARKHPVRRVGLPSEVAQAVAFLATNEFTTGAILTVDGGATARLSTE